MRVKLIGTGKSDDPIRPDLPEGVGYSIKTSPDKEGFVEVEIDDNYKQQLWQDQQDEELEAIVTALEGSL